MSTETGFPTEPEVSYRDPEFIWPPEPIAYTYLGRGGHSIAHRFETGDGAKVLRKDTITDYGFQKDAYAADHFNSAGVYIPKVRQIDQGQDGAYYAVSDLCPGMPYSHFDDQQRTQYAGHVIGTILALEDMPVRGGGYGWWSSTGDAKFNSWQSVIRDQAGRINAFAGQLRNVESAHLLDKATETIEKSIPGLPNMQKLVHGDIAGNMLLDKDGVTGVIDWGDSLYGDPLFDIAKLDLRYGTSLYGDVYRAANGSMDFDARMRCYKLLIGLNDLYQFHLDGDTEQFNLRQTAIQDLL